MMDHSHDFVNTGGKISVGEMMKISNASQKCSLICEMMAPKSIGDCYGTMRSLRASTQVEA